VRSGDGHSGGVSRPTFDTLVDVWLRLEIPFTQSLLAAE